MKSEKDKSASEVEKEGEKVSAGPGKENATGNASKAAEESSDYPGSEKGNVDEVDKKDNKGRMTGYNELPEQENVGK